jgi:HSP20 family protein
MSAVTVWGRPLRRSGFDPLFDSLVRRAFGPTVPFDSRFGADPSFTPAAEVNRDGDDAVVRVELPGVDVDRDVTVEVDRGRLVIRGERRDERAEDRGGRSVREVRYGSFQRVFTLPAQVSAEAISASYDAGVLNVRVAGAYAGSRAQRIPVTAGTTGTPAVESAESTESTE